MAIKTDINRSVLNRNNFKLLIDKVPTVEYYVRTVNIPGVQFGETVQSAGVGLDAVSYTHLTLPTILLV